MESLKEEIPPEILKFARAIRATFGNGVKLYKGLPWMGGSNVKRNG